MKKLFILFVLTFTYSSMSQSLIVFDIDASNFPTIKAKFYAFNKDGKQISNLNPADFEVNENGQPRNVSIVSCPAPQPQQALSSVLVFDVSGSMSEGPPRIQSAKNAANAWIDGLPLGKSECALVSFNDFSTIVQDFTTSRDKLKIAIDKLTPVGGTDYNQALIDLPAGGLQVTKNGKNRKIIVFLTDGLSQKIPRVAEIIQLANDNKITIFAVTLDMPAPQSIKDMTMQTGGKYFENITTQNEAEDIYKRLLQTAQGSKPCEIEWESGAPCIVGITNVEIGITNLGVQATTSYQSPNTSIAKLEFYPTNVKYSNPEVGVTVEEKVTVTAYNAHFNVTNITSNNAAFTITPTSFELKNGKSIILTVSYLPADSGYNFCRFEIENDICQTKYYASGGWQGIKPKVKTLKLIHPNGGEIFVIGSDTLITWEGITELDTVQLEFTIDNGATWKTIPDKANRLLYIWKNIPKPTSANCKVRIKHTINQSGTENIVELKHTLSGHTDRVNTVSWSPDGFSLVTAGGDGTARIWDVLTGVTIHSLSGHNQWVKDVKWSPDDSRVATASEDKTARIWDAESGGSIYTLSGHTEMVLAVSWSPNGSHVATASVDGTARIWDTESGGSIHTLDGHIIDVMAVRWSPDGSSVATAGADGNARIWVAESGGLIHTLSGHTNGVNAINWSPDGTRVVTASDDWTAQIWDAAAGVTLHTLSGHNDEVNAVSWSPDGSSVVTSSADGSARIWDSESGVLIHSLSGHTDVVNAVSWSPDGSLVATASDDRTAIIWNVSSGAPLHTLRGHTNRVKDVKWSPVGSRIATASDDSTAKIWFVGEGSMELQEDESDSVFSIVEPLPSALDVDMLQCLIGYSKDSVVVEFIQNVGSWKFRVDSIYFQGADADAFALVSGIPNYVVEANQNHFAEFRFTPKRVGIHTAEIVIITQAETFTQNIHGEGVNPRMEVVNEFIDFGEVLVGNNRDSLDAVVIKNIGTLPLVITNTKHNFPNDIDFTTLSGGGSFTIQPDDVAMMDLRFKPSDVGRTSGTLELHYDGVGSPAIVQLFGVGIILGATKVTLKTIELDGYAGDEIVAPIILQNQENLIYSGITSIKVDLDFNPTLLYPLDYDFNVIDNKTAKISIENLPINKSDGEVLTNIRFKVGLGNAESCKLTLSNAETVGGEAEIQVIDGKFTLLGICDEGGTRLLNPYSKAGITSISPNPSDNSIFIELSVTEFGNTELSLYNLLGVKVSTIFSESVSQKSIIEVSSDISKIGSGQYLLILRTPTYTEARRLLILR